MHGFFIAGTDTEVGKTAITVGLLNAFLKSKLEVTAIKPVQTGCTQSADNPEDLTAPDVLRYRATGAKAFALKAYEPACSPHLAAELAGERLTADMLTDIFHEKAPKTGWTLVEGAGGVFVPINDDETLLDVMVRFGLPVILVVGNKLGAINHARLTIEALENRGLTIAGMILNRVTPETQLDPGAGDNVANQLRFLENNATSLKRFGEKRDIPLLANLAYQADHLLPEAPLLAAVQTLVEATHTRQTTIDDDLAFDREHLWHPYTSLTNPISVAYVDHAQGRTLTLKNGQPLIDGTSSWWCAMHGYGNTELIEAVQRQAGKLSHVMFGGLTHEPAIRLGRQLLKLVPNGLTGIFYADSGSVAIEVAQKMAIQYWQALGQPGKSRFLTPLGGYHGDTQGAMTVCDPVSGMHTLFKEVLRDQIFIERPQARFDEPFDPSSVTPLEEILKTRHQDIAALILEPIMQGAGGMWFYHPGYLKAARTLCDRYNVLLIADEIATGFGRTGRAFACNWAGIVPDIMCIGKGLTGGMLTLSATLTNDRIKTGIGSASTELGGGAFMHGPTFMANALACAAASASLTLFEKGDWKVQVPAIAKALHEGLTPIKHHPGVKDVRILGAVGVVEMETALNTRRLQPALVERGVWVRPFGNLIYLMPPYSITSDELQTLCRAVREVITQNLWQ